MTRQILLYISLFGLSAGCLAMGIFKAIIYIFAGDPAKMYGAFTMLFLSLLWVTLAGWAKNRIDWQ